MTAPTLQTMLDNVNTRIDALITGGATASFSTGNLHVDTMPLKDLLALRATLKREISNGNAARTYASLVFD